MMNMKKTVTITLKGQRFQLTGAELQQHVLACCDAGLMHFGTAENATAFVDTTRRHRDSHFFSQQNNSGESDPDIIPAEY
ncbi:hypothetical protein [Rahnella sp. ChDrAdgB13]|uniref:hypothetical protein n=1 Tax=Rahnella sp. ChDrAdgB13 TaxID=1850581 RepID=UPI001AD8760A|nr:hypothetical protein [Rahnella sp. ChDrAdgB13]